MSLNEIHNFCKNTPYVFLTVIAVKQIFHKCPISHKYAFLKDFSNFIEKL
jgi:hypothetical protein